MTTDTLSTAPPHKAMIVVDHGSRKAEANALLETVVAQVREQAQGEYIVVEPAHMELAEPSLATAFQRCIDAGADDITVALFFLSPGRHATGDIPRMSAEIQERHPGVRVRVTGPLAPDPRLASLLIERCRQEAE